MPRFNPSTITMISFALAMCAVAFVLFLAAWISWPKNRAFSKFCVCYSVIFAIACIMSSIVFAFDGKLALFAVTFATAFVVVAGLKEIVDDRYKMKPKSD